jgi:hypothetical protein
MSVTLEDTGCGRRGRGDARTTVHGGVVTPSLQVARAMVDT